MKCGWLVVNHFLHSHKFSEIYQWLARSAEKLAIKLSLKTNAELAAGEFCGASPQFVLFWDKDIRLARMMEMQGMRLFNSAAAIEACDDKSLTYLALHGNVQQPRTIIAPKTYENIGYNNFDFVRQAGTLLGFPLVIKECFGSFGQQAFLANDFQDAISIIQGFSCRPFILQELVQSSFGRDVRVNVVGGKVVSAMLRESVSGDFRSNLTLGGQSRPFTPSHAQEAAALKACAAIGLDFGGVDLLFGLEGEPVVCEVNSNAHFKTTYDCTGINMADSIMEYIHTVTENEG